MNSRKGRGVQPAARRAETSREAGHSSDCFPMKELKHMRAFPAIVASGG
jgi:hypothetical protein